MRSTNGLLSNLISNMRDSNNTRKVGITFTISLVLLSVISVSDLTSAQLISSQDAPRMLGEIPRTNDKIFNPKTECSEPIDVKNVSSSSTDNSKNDEMNPWSAFDKDEDTEWSVDNAGAYLEVDLDAVKSICDIEILWEDGDERSYNFVVSASENGIDFKDSIRTKSSGDSDLSESYSIPGTLAKQIRITVYGNSEDETAAIKEVRINGNDVLRVGQEYRICENLPINKFMTTSSQSGDRPENAADGDFATTWSDLGIGSFIQADLGTIKSLCGISIAWYNGESKQYAFEVSVSKDGINFDQVYEGISNGKSIRPQNYALSDADARYVRITIFGNDKNNWAGITELSIKGFTPPNDPPIADPKSVSTDMNIPIPIMLSGSDPEGSVLTFIVEDLPKHGQLSSLSRDTVKYTPDKNFSGSDSFTYTAKDNKGTTGSKATTTIDINEVLECQILDPTVVTAMRSDGNGPSNVIDRNLNTRWSNNEVGSWIQIDLGSKAKICSVDIAWYRGDVRKNDFTVSVSDDGSIFKKVLEEESTGAGTGLEKYNLPSDIEGRFVRITANGNSENNWASITEMAVFGVDSGLEATQIPQVQPNLNDTENDQGIVTSSD
ncbi:MAG TPA: discoidin domain-containing protein [Nitrososphaeraceae archaeon]|nr:discoidin domain-containing protein [Nitrososphaeraceae archaeon]